MMWNQISVMSCLLLVAVLLAAKLFIKTKYTRKVVVMVLVIFMFHNTATMPTTDNADPIAVQLVEKGMPFECIKCNADSIPEPRDKSICQDEWFYLDQAGDQCSLCEFGSIEPSVSRESVARKLVLGFGQIHIMGSSSMRHIYLNLVGAFRGNHDYTNSTIIEHYFHSNSNYAFNGTNDMLFVRQPKGQISLPNTSHAIDFIWNPMLLGLNEKAFRNRLQLKQYSTHQKVMLVMGNHFWSSLFHDHIHMLVNTYINYFLDLQEYLGDVVLVWVYTWPVAEWAPQSSAKNKDIEELKTRAKSFFVEQRERNDNQRVKYLEIDLQQIMQHRFGTKDLTLYYMQEDGMHFMCNFLAPKYHEGPFNTCKHKQSLALDNCTDPIDSLLWEHIYILLNME